MRMPRRWRLGWARVLLLAAILAGVFTMHTAGHAEDGMADPGAAAGIVALVGAPVAGHGLTATHQPGMYAARSAPVQAGPASLEHPDPMTGHGQRHLGCELASMCVGLIAGGFALLRLRGQQTGLPRGPTSAVRELITRITAAPAHPPSLAALSVLRT